jgi:hypothetical protein
VSFFDRHPRFRATSSTDTQGERLEYRHRLLIERTAPLLTGKRVLELASHDGRWTCAALDQGALHVTGIEGKPHLIDRACTTLGEYGFSADRYRFIAGDCLTELAQLRRGEFDTITCFGFLYHTLHHWELLRAMTALEPAALLIDSKFVLDELAAMVLGWDDSSREGAALSEQAEPVRTLVAIPTPRGLAVMLDALGWRCRFLPNLAPSTPQWAGLSDYRAGRRHLVLAWPKGRPDPLDEEPQA